MRTFLIRETEDSDIAAMARIRAAEWETEEHWNKRIHDYLAGELDPKFALKPRVSYTCCEAKSIIGFIAGHLTTRHSYEGELEWINVLPEKRRSGSRESYFVRWQNGSSYKTPCGSAWTSNLSNMIARRFYSRSGAENLKPHWMVRNDIAVVLSNVRP